MASETPKARAKITQACENCRALKIRCIASTESTRCQKCLKTQNPCIFAEQRPPRRKRKRDSKTRVTELESKLEELIARVDQAKQDPHAVEACPKDDVKVLTQRLPNDHTDLSQGLHHLPGPQSTEPIPTTNGFPPSYAYSTAYDDTPVPVTFFGRGQLTLEKACSFLTVFREMSSYFPFVILPTEATLQSMFYERPFLLLAALATASSKENRLQHVLEEELRTTLSTKVVVEGEKSLDLLQGLLVYLAWYHFHYIPRRQQSYQLIQMAIGMTIDLGLNQRPCEASASKVGLHLSHHQGNPQDDEFFSHEARRAYLGCYYLSTSIAAVFGKPNNFEFKDYMFRCCKSLEAEMEAPTDALISPLIKLQRWAEESHETMLLGKSETLTSINVFRVQTHAKVFRAQLQEWESSLSPELQNCAMLTIALHSARINVHEMDLLNPFIPKDRNVDMDKKNESGPRSSVRVDMLFICLEAAKEFFDTFLSIPVAEYRRFSFTEWSRLIVATVVLYKLSLGSPRIPEWDVQIARSTVRLELYLESLCYRMQNISIASPGVPEGTDLFSIMKLIFENVKSTYERLKQLPQAVSASDDSKVHETSFPSRTQYLNRCPAFPYWGKQIHRDLSSELDGTDTGNGDVFPGDPFVGAELSNDHDFWSDMMAEAAYGPGSTVAPNF